MDRLYAYITNAECESDIQFPFDGLGKLNSNDRDTTPNTANPPSSLPLIKMLPHLPHASVLKLISQRKSRYSLLQAAHDARQRKQKHERKERPSTTFHYASSKPPSTLSLKTIPFVSLLSRLRLSFPYASRLLSASSSHRSPRISFLIFQDSTSTTELSFVVHRILPHNLSMPAS